MTWAKTERRPAKQIEGEITPRAPAVRVQSWVENDTEMGRIQAGGAMYQATKLMPLRSESYRRFVASHACFSCGLHGSSQCAHMNFGKGMAMKVCDRNTFPLCFPCHSNLDNTRGMTRDQRRLIERVYVDRMHIIARQAGRKEIP